MSVAIATDNALTFAEVCSMCKLTRATLKRLEAAGEIRVFRPRFGRPRIFRSDLDAFLERSRGPEARAAVEESGAA